jgi:hypothetical protein
MVVNLWRYIFWRHVLPCFSSFSSLQGTQSNGEKKTTSAAYIYIQQQSKIVIKKQQRKIVIKLNNRARFSILPLCEPMKELHCACALIQA